MGSTVRTAQDGDRCEVFVQAGGEDVARLGILDRQMRLGAACVRIGAIAGVKTKPSQRGRGFSRELMQAALEQMRGEGYCISILFGIPGFYHRFGFVNVLASNSVVKVKTAAAETLAGGLAVREARTRDAAALLEIYDAANAGRTGTLARQASAFGGWLDDGDDWWQEERRVLVAEDNGRPVAYALGDWEWLYDSNWNMRPYELAALPQYTGPGTASLVRALAAEAAARREQWLCFELPPDSPAIGVLKPIGMIHTIEFTHNQGGMGRIVELGGLMRAMEEMLGQRVRAAGLQGRVGTVAFTCGADRARSAIGNGATIEITLPQQILLQLVMGYRSIHELRLEFPTCVTEQDVGVVDALFPAGFPYMWRLDHF